MADQTPKKGARNTLTSDDHVKFLIACINHSNEGKVNFKAVGEGQGITAGAAAKRYERLLKANGVDKKKAGVATGGDGKAADDAADDGSSPTPTPAPTPAAKTAKSKTPRAKKATNGDATPKKTLAKKGPVTKKRKLDGVQEEEAVAGADVKVEAEVDNSKSIFGGSEEMQTEA